MFVAVDGFDLVLSRSYGATESCAFKMRASGVRAFKMRPTEVRAIKMRSTEARALKARD